MRRGPFRASCSLVDFDHGLGRCRKRVTERPGDIGAEPQTTLFEPAASAAGTDGRAFTVLEGGQLAVRNLTVLDFGLPAGEVVVGGGAAANFAGFRRVDADYDGRRECDIGAIEYQAPMP